MILSLIANVGRLLLEDSLASSLDPPVPPIMPCVHPLPVLLFPMLLEQVVAYTEAWGFGKALLITILPMESVTTQK